MSAKTELQRLVDLLSEYECGHLLSAVQDVAHGERFWEGDIGLLYNEYVKARFFNIGRNTSNIVPAGPAASDDIFAPIPMVKAYTDAERVQLPAAQPPQGDLGTLLHQRRSRRDYTGAAISAAQLSTMLQASCGATEFVSGYGYTRLPLRSFPSSGGLQSPEVYISVQAVEGISPGIYHYHPIDHVLELLKPGQHGETLQNLSLGQPYVASAAAVFLISGYYERLRWKYGERAFRYMCMDVGFLAQNIYLVGEALKLGVCAIAGFVDDAVEDLLGINGQDEVGLLLVTVGSL